MVMHDDFEEIDKVSRKIMGFMEDEELEYDKVVERYAFLLRCYATNLSYEEFVDRDYYDSLNYSFNYCLGGLLDELNDDTLNSKSLMELKADKNKHYSDILDGAYKIVERFNSYGMTDTASIMGAEFYLIANIIYSYEESLDYARVYS